MDRDIDCDNIKSIINCQVLQKGTEWMDAAFKDFNVDQKLDEEDLPQWIWDSKCRFFHDRGIKQSI